MNEQFLIFVVDNSDISWWEWDGRFISMLIMFKRYSETDYTKC